MTNPDLIHFNSYLNYTHTTQIGFFKLRLRFFFGPNDSADFYLDIDVNDQVKNLYHNLKANHSLFPIYQLICDLVNNKTISDIIHLNHNKISQMVIDPENYAAYLKSNPNSNWALIHLNLVLKKYLGEFTLSTLSRSNLLCRCFGVDTDQLDSLIDPKDEALYDHINEKLRIGLACMSCLGDFQNYLIHHPKLKRRWLGKTKAYWILEINQIIEDYLTFGHFDLADQLEIQAMNFLNIYLKTNMQQEKLDRLTSELPLLIKQKTTFSWQLHFSDNV